jgi:ATP-dependent Clp protease adapter protein ClpS
MSQEPTDRPDNLPEQLPPPREVVRSVDQPARPRFPRCRVVLQHNPLSELMYVVRTVMELTRLCRAEATHKMWESYHCGRSVLLVTNRARAELYAEQFADRGLAVTVEAE